MKYLNFICYSLLLMLLFNTSSLYAAPPLTDHTTHTPLSLMPEPLSGSHDTFSLAATWWLPDWQGSRSSRGSADDGGGDIIKDDSDCMKHYNLYATCPSPKLSTGVVHPVAGMTCQKSCYCPSEYKYTSSNCSGKYTVSGGSCDGKYNDCVCKSEYSQNSSNCNGEYRPAGESCEGNYNRCEMRPECTVSSMSCTYGCAGYNSCDRCTSCKSNPDCDVSDKSCTYGCASYNSCSKCTSCKSNPDCSATAVSCDYGCASTNSCGICTSCSGNPDCDVADKSCDYGCAATNSCGKCTSCKSCSNTCDSGYSLTACSSSQVQTASKTNQCGNSCYSCRAKTCAEQGKKDCNGSCIAKSECCGGCSDGQTCQNGTCVTNHTHSYSCPSGSQASSCSSSQVQTGTPSKVCSCGATSGTCYTCRAKTCEEQGYRYACNNTGYVGKGSPCDGKYKECDCAPGYQWLPTYPGSREQTCQIPDKTCSDSGYYGGSSCSSWSGYSFERCASEYGQMGSSCNAAGNVGSGSCDVDSWRRCCHQCSGSGT